MSDTDEATLGTVSAAPAASHSIAHASHSAVAKRLRRAEGHLRKVISMIEEGRACSDVAQQLQAIESALKSAKQVYIRDHIDNCLDNHMRDGPGAAAVLEEFKVITKYL